MRETERDRHRAILDDTATVRQCRDLGDGLVWLELEAPETAGKAQAGQFAHILCGDVRRAFGFADIDPSHGSVSFQFRAGGERTRWLAARREGEALDVLMPLGRGYRWNGAGRLLLVADVSRPAPILPMLRLLRGDRNADRFARGTSQTQVILIGDGREAPVVVACLREWNVPFACVPRERLNEAAAEALGADVSRATVCAAGPRDMLAELVPIANRAGAELQVAMEAIMTCGIGTCLSCTIPGPRGPEFYRRCCVEGPVFEAGDVTW